jgi:hypothetical protein
MIILLNFILLFYYYCVTVFFPLIDFYIDQMIEVFINHKTIFEDNKSCKFLRIKN